MWMKFINIMLSTRKQTQKSSYCTHLYKVQKQVRLIHVVRRIVASLGEGSEEAN